MWPLRCQRSEAGAIPVTPATNTAPSSSWSRTPPSQGGNSGSNPLGATKLVGWSFNGRIPGLHPGDEGSIPSRSTKLLRGLRVKSAVS